MIHVGIVGYGKMGKIYANIVRSSSVCKLDWIADPNPHVTEATYRVPAMAPGVDVVIIASPTPAHAAQTVGFSATGAVVLVEKPMCMSSESAQFIVESGAPVFVSQPCRYTQHRVPQKGDTMERFAPMNKSWGSKRGMVWDLMVHDLDLAHFHGSALLDRAATLETSMEGNAMQCFVTTPEFVRFHCMMPQDQSSKRGITAEDGSWHPENHDGTEIQRQFNDVVHFMTKGVVPERLCTAEQAKPVIDLLARITK